MIGDGFFVRFVFHCAMLVDGKLYGRADAALEINRFGIAFPGIHILAILQPVMLDIRFAGDKIRVVFDLRKRDKGQGCLILPLGGQNNPEIPEKRILPLKIHRNR